MGGNKLIIIMNNNNNNMVVVVSSLSSSSFFVVVVVVVVVELSHNESVMPKFWCESEKGKFFMLFNCGFLISSSVCEFKTLMS
jgi:hypothetical protein